MLKKLASAIGTLAMVGTSLIGPMAHAGDPVHGAVPTEVRLSFKTHVQSGFPEQDVFVQSSTATEVVRVTPEEAQFGSNLEKPTYASSRTVAQDPFKTGVSPLGPFPKGASLGFTMDSWLMAQGSGTYEVDQSGSSTLNLSFKKLVPNGIYTVVCQRVTQPPTPSIVAVTCAAADGSESALKADANGDSNFRLALKEPLMDSDATVKTVVGLAYHSDGKTCGASPCLSGLNSHLQLIAQVPSPREMSKAQCLALALRTKNEKINEARKVMNDSHRASRASNVTRTRDANKAYNDAVKKANDDKRAADRAARDARTASLNQARLTYTDDIRAAATELDRDLARERRDAAVDAANVQSEIDLHASLMAHHAAMNAAKTRLAADKAKIQTDLDAERDQATANFLAAKAAALRTFHATRTGCFQIAATKR